MALSPVLPFPPQIHGPIFSISPQLHLTGVFSGHQVRIQGSENGMLADHLYSGIGYDQCIPLAVQPSEGEYIVVTQHRQDSDGNVIESAASPKEVAVAIPVPNPLPPPALDGIVHTCSDFIGISGLIPGATVHAEIETVGKIVERLVECTTSGAFEMDYAGPLPSGETIKIWQTAIVKDKPRTSEAIRSPPIADLGLSNPLNSPKATPPQQCSNHLEVLDLLAGATFIVLAPANSDLFGVDIYESGKKYTFDGKFRQPLNLGNLNMFQAMQRCGLRSNDVQVAVVPRTDGNLLKTPKRILDICEDLSKVTLTDLYPNGDVFLQATRIVEGESGTRENADEDRQVAKIPIVNETQYITLPTDWSLTDSRGRVAFDFSQLSDGGSCALKSNPSGPQYVVPNTGNAPTRPVIDPEPLYECGNTIRAQSLMKNAEVQLLRTDGIPLNEAQPVTSIDPLLLSLPYRIGRMPDDVGGFHAFQLVQRGCGAGGSLSNKLYPAPYPGDKLPDPHLGALRPGDMKLQAAGLIPGAKVTVMVDQSPYLKGSPGILFANEITVLEAEPIIDLLYPLQDQQQVFLIQKLCDESSSLKAPGKPVEKATLQVTVEPSGPLTKGQQYSVTVHATDPETGVMDSPAFGSVKLNYFAASFKLGRTVTGTVPESITASTLTGTVFGTSVNHEAAFTIQLKDPPPPPDFVLNIRAAIPLFSTPLPATLGATSSIRCTSVTFDVISSWAGTKRAVGTLHQDSRRGDNYHASVSFPGIRPSTPNVDSYTISVTGTARYTSDLIGDIGEVRLSPFSEHNTGVKNRPNPARNKGCFYFNLSFYWTPDTIPIFKWAASADVSAAAFDNWFGMYDVDDCLDL